MERSHSETDRADSVGNATQSPQQIGQTPGSRTKMTAGAFAGQWMGRQTARRDAKWGVGATGLLIVLLGAVVVHKLYAEKTEPPAAAPTALPQAEAKQTAPKTTEPLFGEFQLELPSEKRATSPGKAAAAADQQDPFASGRPLPRQLSASQGSGTAAPGTAATPFREWAASGESPQSTSGSTRFQRSVSAGELPRPLIRATPAEPVGTAIAPAGATRQPAQQNDPFAASSIPISTAQQPREAARPLTLPEGARNERAAGFQEPIRQTDHSDAAPLLDLSDPQLSPAPIEPENTFVPSPSSDAAIEAAAAVPTPAPAPSPPVDGAGEPTPWTFESSQPVPLPEAPRSSPLQPVEPNPFAERPTAAPAALSSPSQSLSETAAIDRIHDVVPGDNYWTISRQHYGTGRYFGALAEYNRQRIPRPEKMKPGMKVLIPDAAVLDQRYPRLTGQGEIEKLPAGVPEQGFFVDANGQPMYRIGKGDTLTEIAETHLGRMTRWTEIMVMNREQLRNPNALKLGMILRLPRDASRVTLAPEGAVIR